MQHNLYYFMGISSCKHTEQQSCIKTTPFCKQHPTLVFLVVFASIHFKTHLHLVSWLRWMQTYISAPLIFFHGMDMENFTYSHKLNKPK
jgi:hypothetical protein